MKSKNPLNSCEKWCHSKAELYGSKFCNVNAVFTLLLWFRITCNDDIAFCLKSHHNVCAEKCSENLRNHAECALEVDEWSQTSLTHFNQGNQAIAWKKLSYFFIKFPLLSFLLISYSKEFLWASFSHMYCTLSGITKYTQKYQFSKHFRKFKNAHTFGD